MAENDSAAAETSRRPAPADAGPAIDLTARLMQMASFKPTTDGAEAPKPDFEALSRNTARIAELGGQAIAAYLKPMEDGRTNPDFAETLGDVVQTFGRVAQHWLADPQRLAQAQSAFTSPFVSLWGDTLRRMTGEAPSEAEPARTDKRFADPEWQKSPFFDFLRQAYLLGTAWADDMVRHADTIDPATRDKAQFYVRQVSAALSPSNFLATNPELIRKTFEENGSNLVRGMQMFAEDIEAGKGQLKIRQSDPSGTRIGIDTANTPGKVVFRNDLLELIQYAPSTETVYRRPLLIIPPWINKFYVLDLNPKKSFVRWAVAQGLTVFVVSWVNPDERHADKDFESYMREGLFAAADAIEAATGEREIAAIGYCVGGTLLACTLAYMAAQGDTRITSVTFLTTQVDFTDPGDLKFFVDKDRIEAIEAKMKQTGYLEGTQMASAFNMLRPDDLIWSYVVNNYLKGKEPLPFDLLTWNSDATRMPAANHSFYLRNCYIGNTLAKGEMVLGGVPLDLRKVTIPVYNLAAREDHIAPPRSVFTGSKLFGGPMRYVLSGSGHIAGVVNPPAANKYQYWIGEPRDNETFDEWLARADEHPGSWWTDWIAWITAQAPDRVPARTPGSDRLPALGDAPGEYVLVKS